MFPQEHNWKQTKAVAASSKTMYASENLRVVLYWNGLLCLLPTYRVREFYKQKFLATAVSILFVTLYVYSIIFKLQSTQSSGVFMDVILITAMTSTNISVIMGAAHWHFAHINDIFRSFNTIDKLSHVKIQVHYVVVLFVILNIFLLVLIAFHVFTWTYGQNMLEYRYRIIEMIQMYYSTLIVYFEYSLLRHVLHRFVKFNAQLENVDFFKLSMQISHQETETLTNLHNILCDVCDLFNDVYGWQMLMSIFNVVFNILKMIDYILNTHDDYSLSHLVFIVLITTFYCTQTVVIATKCEQLANEGKRTVTIAYKALHRYSSIQSLRERLFILAQQAGARCPQFTAAGFFNVDYSMLFTFVNLITTYVIVIIQFSSTGSPSPPQLNTTLVGNQTNVA